MALYLPPFLQIHCQWRILLFGRSVLVFFWWGWCYLHKRPPCPLAHWCCWWGQESYPGLWIQSIPAELQCCCRFLVIFSVFLMTGWCQQDGVVVSKTILSQFGGLGLNRSLFLLDLKQPNIKELPDFYRGLLRKGLVDHSLPQCLLQE